MTRTKKASAQVKTDGRVTIPKTTRDELGLDVGDFVILEVQRVEEDEDD